MNEAEKLLKEAKKIIQASSTGRSLNKDWLQRASDYFRRQSKAEPTQSNLRVVELEAQLAEAKAESRDACIGLHDYYAPKVALLREALERCAMFKLQPDTIQQITNRALAATEEKK